MEAPLSVLASILVLLVAVPAAATPWKVSTWPGKRSPRTRQCPACNQDRSIRHDVLGTSLGWSDIYSADYDKQYIDVSGLRGCFVFGMTVDPKHLLFESNERDNSSHLRVSLPFTGAGC